MKKIAVSVIFVMMTLTSTPLLADNDKPIAFEQLPTAAQTVVKTHFAGKTVALAKVESELLDKNYDVVFTTGEKVEFDKKGNWTEVDCRNSAVPSYFVPSAIASYVNTYYAGQAIVKIEKEDRGEYEVTISNGIELTFNKKFQLIDID